LSRWAKTITLSTIEPNLSILVRQDKDRLTVVRDDGDGTSLLIGMDSRSTNFFCVEDFEGSGKRLNN
jgi:hypothetical protein